MCRFLPLLFITLFASFGGAHAEVQTLLDPAQFDKSEWKHATFGAKTDYRVESVGGQPALVARGAASGSASGLMRATTIDLRRCARLTWTWRVEKAQPGADIARKDGDDVAASVFVMFDKPGLFGAGRRAPTLRYVWTGGAEAVGRVVDSPYLPGVVRSLVSPTAQRRWAVGERKTATSWPTPGRPFPA